MVQIESGLNCEVQVLLMRPIYIVKGILVLIQVVLIARVVLISSGLYSGTLPYKIVMLGRRIKQKFPYIETSKSAE